MPRMNSSLRQAAASAGSSLSGRATSIAAAAQTSAPSLPLQTRSISSSSRASNPHSTSPKAKRAHERTLRSAIELYHLAPSFFPTPAQTKGWGAACEPPEPEPKAHARALDSAIRSSIQVLAAAEAENRMGDRTSDGLRPVIALRADDLLEQLERPGGSHQRDGRGVGGPVYKPGEPAPLVSLALKNTSRSAASDDRVGPEAQRSMERMMSTLPGSGSTAASSSPPPAQAPHPLDAPLSDEARARAQMRFKASRHPTPKEAAYQEAVLVHQLYLTDLHDSHAYTRNWISPFGAGALLPERVSLNRVPGGVPKDVIAAVEASGLVQPAPPPSTYEDSHVRAPAPASSSGPAQAGVRRTSATARADLLDERSARVRDALFGTVAAELPGLEVIRERKRLRELREKKGFF